MPVQKVVRNAKTGKFAKKKKAMSAPASHVTETIKIKKNSKKITPKKKPKS